MYGQRLYKHVSLISHPYGDSSAPPLFRHRDPYDPLLSVDRRTRTRTNLLQLQYPPGDTDKNLLIIYSKYIFKYYILSIILVF